MIWIVTWTHYKSQFQKDCFFFFVRFRVSWFVCLVSRKEVSCAERITPNCTQQRQKYFCSSQTAENLKVTENLRLPLPKNCALLWGEALRGSGMIRHWDESQQQDIIWLPWTLPLTFSYGYWEAIRSQRIPSCFAPMHVKKTQFPGLSPIERRSPTEAVEGEYSSECWHCGIFLNWCFSKLRLFHWTTSSGFLWPLWLDVTDDIGVQWQVAR